eukprot:4313255-Pleurochrysis_carterae.AAC.2
MQHALAVVCVGPFQRPHAHLCALAARVPLRSIRAQAPFLTQRVWLLLVETQPSERTARLRQSLCLARCGAAT